MGLLKLLCFVDKEYYVGDFVGCDCSHVETPVGERKVGMIQHEFAKAYLHHYLILYNNSLGESSQTNSVSF